MILKLIKATTAASAAAWSALWTFPSILLSAFVIAWAAEAAQFLISQGLALAILAWLQTLPEFAVEAVIAWQAGKDPTKTHLAIANFTGSLRLLVGLGWPMIYFVAAAFGWKRERKFISVELDDEHSVEVFGLFLPIAYFTFIWWKGTLSIWDAIPLTASYVLYCSSSGRSRRAMTNEEALDDLGIVPRTVLQLPPKRRNASIWILFIAGGAILFFAAHPFLNSMLAIATSLGVSTFVFVQWVAPFLSEFPEKLSAFYWARKVKHGERRADEHGVVEHQPVEHPLGDDPDPLRDQRRRDCGRSMFDAHAAPRNPPHDPAELSRISAAAEPAS